MQLFPHYFLELLLKKTESTIRPRRGCRVWPWEEQVRVTDIFLSCTDSAASGNFIDRCLVPSQGPFGQFSGRHSQTFQPFKCHSIIRNHICLIVPSINTTKTPQQNTTIHLFNFNQFQDVQDFHGHLISKHFHTLVTASKYYYKPLRNLKPYDTHVRLQLHRNHL